MSGRRSGSSGWGWWMGGGRLSRVVAAAVAALLVGVVSPSTPAVAKGQGGRTGSTGAAPQQRWGSAAGRPHEVPASATRAPAGSQKGGSDITPPGALPMFRPFGPVVPAKPSGTVHDGVEVSPAPAPAFHGFDPETSHEVPERRGPFDRTFANADGTRTTRVYQEAVNFRRPDGTWAPFDTTVRPRGRSGGSATVQDLPAGEPTPTTGGSWQATAGNDTIYFAPTGDGVPLALLTLDADHSVGYSVDGGLPVTGQAQGSTVTYPGILDQADLQFSVLTTGIQETLVLRSPAAPTTWLFPLQLQGLSASVTSDGDVALTDSTGVVRAAFPRGFMEDSNIDPHSGDGQISTGISYRIVDLNGGQALQVSLDTAWLNDPARVFPVNVDPSVRDVSSSTDSTFVLSPFNADNSGAVELKVGTYDAGANIANAFLDFASVSTVLNNQYVLGATLGLFNTWSYSCTPRQIWVHPITQSWTPSLVRTYPGPSVGSALVSSNFAHGWVPSGGGSSPCPAAWQGINLGTAGKNLVEGWTHGQPNHGLSLRASTTDSYGWKKFANTTSGAAYLAVTYTKYGAAYSVSTAQPNPLVLSTQDGATKVTVTNLGTDTWTPTNGYKLGYHIYDYASGKSLGNGPLTAMPTNVAPRAKVTVNAKIGKLPAGKYVLVWDMQSSGTWFTSQSIPGAQMVLTVPNQAPVVDAQYPPAGYVEGVLTPQLYIVGHDPDGTSTLKYQFKVCDGTPAAPTNCVDSGLITNPIWAVPVGHLKWSHTYYWQAWINDGTTNSPTSAPSALITEVPQPDITGHLAQARYSGNEAGIDPQVGNYTTSVTDANVATVGPDLTVTRTYNSLDPRTGGMFGAGWSSRFDMAAVPDNDGSGNIVVRYPDGREVRFGLNPDGTFAPPEGDFATLKPVTGGGWTLTDTSATTYTFDATGRLIAVTDRDGRAQTLTYAADGTLATVTNTTSGRALHFAWVAGHVGILATDPPTAGSTPISWTYTYTGDLLTEVCTPTSSCTHYDYATGSHYRSAVLDSAPHSYWRLDETTGTAAASEVDVNQGTDTVTYTNVTLGAPGALGGTADTAATFDGTTSYVALQDNLIRHDTYLAAELWFKTTSPGVLLSYQAKSITDSTASTAGNHVPALYVGTDGRLYGEYWMGSGSSGNAIASTSTVNNGQWHQAVLSGAGNTQTLYLDGAAVGSRTGQITQLDMVHTYLGTGADWGTWPQHPTDPLGHFNGAIDDVSFYDHPLGPPTVAAHFAAAQATASQLTQITLPAGNPYVQVSYDTTTDRVSHYTDPNGGEWDLGTPAVSGTGTDLARQITLTDPAGNDRTYRYDPLHGGRIISYSPTPDLVRTFGYDTGGFQSTITDENGNTVTLTHDPRGNILSRKTCRAENTCYTGYYSYYLNTTDPTDPRNDALLTYRDPRSAGPTDNTYAINYTYTPTGDLAAVSSPINLFETNRTTRAYTAGVETAADGGTEPPGLLASITDTYNNTTNLIYNANGDLARTVDADGLVTAYTYDALGRTSTTTQISNTFPNGVSTSYTYTPLSQLDTVTEPTIHNEVTAVSHTRQTSYTYDLNGNLSTTTVADTTGGDSARVTTYTYDEHDRPIAITDPQGGVTGYSYDGFGNTTRIIDANGNEFDYTYTLQNEVATKTLRNWIGDPSAPSQATDLVVDSYAYDPGGRLASHSDAMGRTATYTYYDDDLPATATLANYHETDANGNVTTRDVVLEADTYDAAGHMVKRVTGGGKTETDYVYFNGGQLEAEILDPAGLNRRTDYFYYNNGNLEDVEFSSPSSSRHLYLNFERDDSMGRVDFINLQSTDEGGFVGLWLERDNRGYPTAVRDFRDTPSTADRTTNLTYDEAGRLSVVTGPPVPVESEGGPADTVRPTSVVGYDTFGDVTEVKDPDGDITRAHYDGLGRRTTLREPSYAPPDGSSALQPTIETSYDPSGHLTSETDPLGRTTSYAYDQLGHLVQRTDPQPAGAPAPGMWHYSRDPLGELLAVTDPLGAKTEATYDDLGRLATSTHVERHAYDIEGNPGPAPANYTTSFTYDDAGDLTKAVMPSGWTSTASYDAAGEAVLLSPRPGQTSQISYELDGLVSKITDGLGLSTTYAYDLAGRLIQSTDLDTTGATIRSQSFDYDEASNLISATDALGHSTTYTYDAANRLTQMVEPVDDTHSIATSFGYDAAGNLTRYTDGRGNSTVTTYNSLGLPESVIEPSTAAYPDVADRTYTTSYDAAGRPVQVSEPGGATRTRSYDELGRLVSETGAGGEAPTAERTFGYDLAGRLTSASAPGGQDTFGYDDRGNLLSTAGPSGTATFAYDADGQMIRRADGAGAAKYTYLNGQLHEALDPVTGNWRRYGYDATGQLTSILNETAPGGAYESAETFTYDSLHRLVGQQVESNTAPAPPQPILASITYGYDLADHLTSKTTAGTAGAGTSTYTYDQAGRLTSATTGGTTTTYAFDDAGNRTQAGVLAATYDERNRLTSQGDTTYTYTPRGTQASATTGGTTRPRAFDAFDRLVSDGATSYGYDALDRVVTRGTTTLAYSGLGNTIVADGTATYGRGPDGNLTGIGQATDALTPLTDIHGDLVGTYHQTDPALLDSVAYDPFGQPTATTGTHRNIGYQGEWTDPDTGGVDMAARWYDPAIGGFTSRDTAPANLVPSSLANRYTYGAANPLTTTDPSGHNPVAVAAAVEAGEAAAAGCEVGAIGGPVGCGAGAVVNIILAGATIYAANKLTEDDDGSVGEAVRNAARQHGGSGSTGTGWSSVCEVLPEKCVDFDFDSDPDIEGDPGTSPRGGGKPKPHYHHNTPPPPPRDLYSGPHPKKADPRPPSQINIVDPVNPYSGPEDLVGGAAQVVEAAPITTPFTPPVADPTTGGRNTSNVTTTDTGSEINAGMQTGGRPQLPPTNPPLADPPPPEPAAGGAGGGGGSGGGGTPPVAPTPDGDPHPDDDEPFKDFAHGTTVSSAQDIVERGLDAEVAKNSSLGGRYSAKGSFFTFEINPEQTEGLQLAYEMGSRHASATGEACVVVVCSIPKSTFDELEEAGLVRVSTIPGTDVPETVFDPGAFGRINAEAIWQVIKP
jgi:RHS repeat-associated protein